MHLFFCACGPVHMHVFLGISTHMYVVLAFGYVYVYLSICSSMHAFLRVCDCIYVRDSGLVGLYIC